MRIISGKYKGRQLVNFKADHIRPTMDRVKETIFNKWMMYVDGAKVLDLFAGTGNLGIEALSRGAIHVTFVENNNKSMNILKENLQLLKINLSEYQIQLKDVMAFARQKSDTNYDLIFIDPPFTEKMAHDVMNAVGKSKLFGTHTRIVIESIKQERIDDTYGDLVCYDRLDYGDKFLSFFAQPE
ncbi:MAG: 16S rRNA (guanine(966)-N(2))-methyltransferase RsmD [Moraxellaceae bacterium]|nr:16S rRNA (guanine(966)-N(2))-methyltransferase RsmD [Pseudobdellovibrionaceae bacterium]